MDQISGSVSGEIQPFFSYPAGYRILKNQISGFRISGRISGKLDINKTFFLIFYNLRYLNSLVTLSNDEQSYCVIISFQIISKLTKMDSSNIGPFHVHIIVVILTKQPYSFKHRGFVKGLLSNRIIQKTEKE